MDKFKRRFIREFIANNTEKEISRSMREIQLAITRERLKEEHDLTVSDKQWHKICQG